LISWVECRYGDIFLHGLMLRRGEDRDLYVAFPSRTSRNGMRHAIIRPADEQARREIECQILDEFARRAGELGT